MLSDRFYRAMSICIPICSKFGICRYTWDPYRNLVTRRPDNRRNNKIVNFNLSLLFIWIIFQAAQIIRFYFAEDLNAVIFLVACIMALLISLISNYMILIVPDDLYVTINWGLIFLKKMNVEFLPNHDPNRSKYMKLVDFTGFTIFGSVLLLALTTCIYFAYEPNGYDRFGNVLPANVWYFIPLTYMFPIYATCVLYTNFALLLLLCLYVGTVLIPFIVRELRLGRGKKYKSIESLRDAPNITIVYRAVQILTTQISQLCGILLIPAQGVCTILFVFTSYVFIRHRKEMAMTPFVIMVLWMGLAPVIWSLVLTMGGYLHSYGLKILRSWRKHQWRSPREKKIMNKFTASCTPVMICYGKVFVIKRVSLMVYIRGLFRGLLRALLTLELKK